MATMRPALKDFSAGQVNLSLDGRCDLEVHARTSRVMRNFKPRKLGGFSRRGGLRHILPLTGDCRLIPWSVMDGLDILVAIYDRSIALINVTDGTTPAVLTAANLPITALTGAIQTYSLADAPDVVYAQGTKQMFFAHPDYPLFQIRYDSSTTVDDVTTLNFSYGTVSITGNIAYSPSLTEEELTSGDPFTSSTFIASMMSLSPTHEYTATGYINGKAVSKIQRIETARARRAYISATHYLYSDIAGTWIADATAHVPYINVSQLEWYGLKDSYAGPYRFRPLLIKPTSGSTTVSGTAVLDWLEAAERAGTILDDVSYMLIVDLSFDLVDAVGSIKFQGASAAVSTVKVTFADADATTQTFAADYGSMTGYVKVFSALAEQIIDFNTYTVDAQKILDNCSPWMTPEKAYPCDSTTMFDGGYPISATRYTGGKVYDQSGTLISDGEAGLHVFFTGTKPPVYVSASGGAFSGSLGVIVTPFFQAQDYPGFVSFHQGRLVLGGSNVEPNVLYLSKANDITNFCFFEEVAFQSTTIASYDTGGIPVYSTEDKIIQQIGAASAIKMRIVTEENERIQWAASVRDLVVATATSEFVIPANITALEPTITLVSRNGSSGMQGRFVEGLVVFASFTGDRLCGFSVQSGPTDMTELASDLFSAGIKSVDFRQNPTTELYVTLEDGTGVIGTPGASGMGWTPVETRDGDLIRSMVTISGPSEDCVYAAVKRGATYYLEQLVSADDGTFLGRVYLDNSTTGTSEGSGTIAGAGRFYGQDGVLVCFSSGLWGTPTVSAAGVIETFTPRATTENPAPLPLAVPSSTYYHLGYEYESNYESHLLDTPDTDGVKKAGGDVYFRVYESGEFDLVYIRLDGVTDNTSVVFLGPDASGVEAYPYSGTIKTSYLAPAREDQTVTIRARGPESVNILSIAPVLTVGDTV